MVRGGDRARGQDKRAVARILYLTQQGTCQTTKRELYRALFTHAYGGEEFCLDSSDAGAAAEDERGESCDRCNDPTHIDDASLRQSYTGYIGIPGLALKGSLVPIPDRNVGSRTVFV